MRVAILTFDGFNELDSFVSLSLINRLRSFGVQAELVGAAAQVTSMNGVTVTTQRPLEAAREADVVLFGSGIHTRRLVEDEALLKRITLDPSRQLIGSQCSGALFLARLGLLGDMPACTDLVTKPLLLEGGGRVADLSFFARGPMATAGGCMASTYLATWVMWRAVGREETRKALHYAAPVGEQDSWTDHALAIVGGSIGKSAPS